MCRGRRLAPGRRRTPRGPGSPRPRADAGGDSREHRDGRPHHAVREAAPLHVHDAAASTAKLLLVRPGRRRRLHFRHPGRGWQRRRQQEWRTPFRFRHAARAPLRPAPAPAPLARWRHFPKVGSARFDLPAGNRSRVLLGPAHLLRRPPASGVRASTEPQRKGFPQAALSLARETDLELCNSVR